MSFSSEAGWAGPFISPWKFCRISGFFAACFTGFGRRSRIQRVETDILDNPSPANYEELGETLQRSEAVREGARSIYKCDRGAKRFDLYVLFAGPVFAGADDLTGAIPDLERVVTADRKFDYYRAAGLLADAYARTGQLERADALFAEVTPNFNDARDAL